MKKVILALIMFFAATDTGFAEQWISPPQIIQPSPQILIVESIPQVVPARTLTKTIEWILTPQVNNVVVSEIHRGLFGRQYIVNRNELVTTWVYVPVEIWK